VWCGVVGGRHGVGDRPGGVVDIAGIDGEGWRVIAGREVNHVNRVVASCYIRPCVGWIDCDGRRTDPDGEGYGITAGSGRVGVDIIKVRVEHRHRAVAISYQGSAALDGDGYRRTVHRPAPSKEILSRRKVVIQVEYKHTLRAI